jgi:hypothetical protein
MSEDKCPKCGSSLSAQETTPTGKKLQRCSQGQWNSETRQTEGCAFVKWIQDPPQELDEKCPKCGEKLLLQTTRFGKKMKKCSAGGWDREEKKPTGCTYVDWLDERQILDEKCPKCENKLVLTTVSGGKKLKKCETAGWDSKNKTATGCDYVEWLNTRGGVYNKNDRQSNSQNQDEQMPDFDI